MLEAGAVRFRVATGRNAGAIAVFELIGDERALNRLVEVGLISWLGGDALIAVGALRLARFLDGEGEEGGVIDTGVVGRVNAGMMQLMPHGGPRIVRRLMDALVGVGAELVVEGEGVGELGFWAEAGSDIEAMMLGVLSGAASGDAVDLLLKQPGLWEAFWEAHEDGVVGAPELAEIHGRARTLKRLLVPPMVVLCGAANVGKSTLTNALAGRATSIASERAGTTRDYVGVLIDLGGLTVWWYDTPGRREVGQDGGEVDEIEREAVRISGLLRERADLVIEASDGVGGDDAEDVERVLRVVLKGDLLGGGEASEGDGGGELVVSALNGEGMDGLVEAVRERLVPQAMLDGRHPWLFCEELLGNRLSGVGDL